MKFYKVVCKRGHCGKKRFIPITFYFEAPNAMTAMDMGRKMPGVKHSQLPLSCVEVSCEEFQAGIQVSAYAR